MSNTRKCDYISQLGLISGKQQVSIVYDGISFPIGSSDHEIFGENPKDALLMQYSPVFSSELDLYPPHFIERSGIQRIVLATNLIYKNRRLAGFFLIAHKTIYLDTAWIRLAEQYSRFAIHHEIFHSVNFFALGNFVQDEEWERLNSPAFRCGLQDESNIFDKDPFVITRAVPGFLNRHSTSNLAEDKATIFGHLMSNYLELAEVALTDQIIQAKITKLKDALEKKFPEMDTSFWQNVKQKQF